MSLQLHSAVSHRMATASHDISRTSHGIPGTSQSVSHEISRYSTDLRYLSSHCARTPILSCSTPPLFPDLLLQKFPTTLTRHIGTVLCINIQSKTSLYLGQTDRLKGNQYAVHIARGLLFYLVPGTRYGFSKYFRLPTMPPLGFSLHLGQWIIL